MDISISSYYLIFPLVLLTFYPFAPKFFVSIINVYTALVSFFVLILIIADAELYSNWGVRFDATPLLYLKNPVDALASVSGFLFMFLITLLFLLLFIAYRSHQYLVNKYSFFSIHYYYPFLINIVLILFLIIPIRGGIGIAPLNIGFVYFSNHNYANHAAINVNWNFFHSALNNDPLNTHNLSLNSNTAKSIFTEMTSKNYPSGNLINSQNPNIIVFILESFTAKLMFSHSGMKGITPNLDSIAASGIYFKNFYASGDRTDKGLVAILSGYPALPDNSIIKFPLKTEKLPSLTKALSARNYYSAFYYGGNIDFASMRSYLTINRFDKIISDKDFDKKDQNSKWGVHDHLLLKYLLNDLVSLPKPFFAACLTLSSHEPFEVPIPNYLPDDTEEQRFLKSAYYTDEALGNFFKAFKNSPLYKNTLLVFIADHGSRFPGNDFVVPEKYIIPMIWSGGAITKDTIITQVGSQIDFPLLLLSNLNIDGSDFQFSKNFITAPHSFAVYSFNSGFGYVDNTGFLIYDFNKNALDQTSYPDPQLQLTNAKAFMMELFQNFEAL